MFLQSRYQSPVNMGHAGDEFELPAIFRHVRIAAELGSATRPTLGVFVSVQSAGISFKCSPILGHSGRVCVVGIRCSYLG